MSFFRVPTVLVDTREKSPWLFTGRKVRVKQQVLKVGDYAIQGHQSGLVVERKSVEDLFLTMTRGLARFKRELERARTECGVALMVVIVEGDLERIGLGSRWSWANPGRVIEQFYSVCVRAGVAPYVASGRAEAEALAWRLLFGYWSSSIKE